MSRPPLPFQTPPPKGKDLIMYNMEEHVLLEQNMEALLDEADAVSDKVGADFRRRISDDQRIVRYLGYMNADCGSVNPKMVAKARTNAGLEAGKVIKVYWNWLDLHIEEKNKEMEDLRQILESDSAVASYSLNKKLVVKSGYSNLPEPAKMVHFANTPTTTTSIAKTTSTANSEEVDPWSIPSPPAPTPSKAPISPDETDEPDPAADLSNEKALINLLHRDLERRRYVLKLNEKEKYEKLVTHESTGKTYKCPITGKLVEEHPTQSSSAMVDRQQEWYNQVISELNDIRRQLVALNQDEKKLIERRQKLVN